ncbi:DUF547 domain-containing protein [Aquimarina sp. 2304DJ70-9]|uniref:DUF547 domain-containing protein n=1 Tax=Aquimarina penaris TaxID=3231044 RepID=UPI003462B9A1
MKNLLIIASICLFFACGGSKNVVQHAPKTTTTEYTTPEENTETPKIVAPIEEKAPEPKTEEEPPKPKAAAEKEEEEEKPKTVSKALSHQPWNTLLAKHVSADGIVNYKGFKQDRAQFRTYLKALEQNAPGKTASKADKLAYWMNVYNAFTIKLIIDKYPIKSIKDIADPWDLRFFKIGTTWYTLNDIEHRILRKMNDPRIHFGINCASFSCPPLLNKAFTAQNVDQELEKLAIAFINDPKRNTITAEKIEISKIFSWFGKDFKKEGSLIDFLNKYSNIVINTDAKKSFKAYDWSLNE